MTNRFIPARCLLSGWLMTLGAALFAAAPVEFTFELEHDEEENPFARDIWAEIETPAAERLHLPAFFTGESRWAVRTRSIEKGNYRFMGAQEVVGTEVRPLEVDLQGKDRIRPRDTDDLGTPVSVDRRTGRTFRKGDGEIYVPLGGNLPWADMDDVVEFYRDNLRTFRDAGLNWTRIWMCHWGRLNLDWIEPHHGETPPIGQLDLGVAERWDQVIAAADAANVRVQIVLQHHGQYSTTVNSDWDANPWNSANGGFLDSPADFFSSPQAREITRAKYRYIVARWGYSSAILAWELFNESMWTDARRGDERSNAIVADWHAEMARYLRRYDAHNHLVTTSDDDLQHELWSAMDYYQPHLYASNMVLGVQTLSHPPIDQNRPVFYGEVGDNNMVGLTTEQRANGAAHVPMAWAGLFGSATHPAQLWYIDVLRQNDRLPELFSLAQFARESGALDHSLTHTTRPRVIGGDLTSWKIMPGHYWERGPNPEIELPWAGYEGPELMTFRRILVDGSASPAHPYPHRATFRFFSPAASTATLRLANVSNSGGSLRVTLDGDSVVNEAWPALTVGNPVPADLSYDFRLGYGEHELILENPYGPDWVDLGGIDLGIEVPALVAVARHGTGRSILWVRHRNQLLSAAADEDLSKTTGTVQLEDYPAGNWQITWWDSAKGGVTHQEIIGHSGGTLSLKTPAIARHVAAWIERAR
ncbi:MAG: hypothetical protein SynsKO_28270 [Synoicihabitans sp.]